MEKEYKGNPKAIKWIVIVIIILILGIFLVGQCFVTVDSGSVGIVTQFGAVNGEVLYPGLHFKTPFITNIKRVNVQTQKVESDSAAATRDLQVISTTVAINYHIDPTAAVTLYESVGTGYESTIISPALQESVKAVFARFSAEQLITQRQEVSIQIRDELSEKLTPYGIVTDGFNIVNLDFSAEFNAAIEAKQTAQQNALRAEQELNRITIEAQQQVEQAKAEGDAIKTIADAEAYSIETIQKQLEKSDKYLEYIKIQQWDGRLPQVQGDATPIIDLREEQSYGPVNTTDTAE